MRPASTQARNELPRNVCQTSGGSPACRRAASATWTLLPPPPAMAPSIDLHVGVPRLEGVEQYLESRMLRGRHPPRDDFESVGRFGEVGLLPAATAGREHDCQHDDPVALHAARSPTLWGVAFRSKTAKLATTAKQTAGTMNEIAGLVASSREPWIKRHDRPADDGHHQSGRAELRCGTEPLESDAVDRREHQGQAEGQRDDGGHPGHVRREHGEDAEHDRQRGEDREDLRRADLPDDPRHDEPGDEEHDQADLQEIAAQLERSVQRLLRVLDQVGPRADLGGDIEELRDRLRTRSACSTAGS